MKAGDALLAVLLFVFTIGLIQVSPAEVVYWESENDAENDYLKVKYRELVGHVMRFKRSGFDFLDTSTSTSLTTRENYDSTLEEDTAEDELDSDIGSGSPDRENADTEPREKTLRVTFVVIQPYHEEYNKRDSLQFKTFSTSLADAVNQLFDLLPGTQKASLVRIQSRISDEFTCKVTLDIVTTGYDDTDRIAKILRDHIRNKRALGSVAVNDNEFSANVVDSENCGADDFRCSNGKCIEASRRCDRIVDCPSNEDEKDCECRADEFTCLSDHSCIEVRKICDGVPNCSDSSDEADCACSSDQWQCDHGNCIKRNKRCDGRIDCPTDRSDERNCYECNHECDGRCLEDQQICNGQYDCSDDSDELHCDECDGPTDFRCKSSGECLNIAQRCNGVPECPDYSDEQGCNDSVTPVEYGCLGNQFQCHVGTCIDNEFVCDGNNDCIDNSDEENCPCTSNEFQCESGQCIRRSEYCDSIPQCTDGTDEQGCPTTRSWLTTTVYPTYHLPSSSYRPQTTYHSVSSIPVTISPLYSATAYPKPQLPESGFTELNLKIYPDQLSLKHGGDVVFQCRDEGPHRAPVRWVRQGGRPLKPGYTDRNGRLEMIAVSPADSGVYICQAIHYLGYPGAEVRVSLIVDPASPPRTPGIPPCHAYQATCGNGECIPKQAICDGNKDCTDGSDEDNCNPNGQCEPNQFKCANRKCVLKTWLCDYEDDCGDGSDEANCGSSVARPGECLAVEFTCHTKNQCVPKSFHCDSQSDCFDGSDEIGCAPIHVIKPPYPSNTRISAGKTLVLTCEAVGVPTPLISWRLNWGHVPQNCTSTSNSGIGVLTCHNMQPEHSGAYSCEAINNKGTTFASPDAIVYVNKTDVCPSGYFNSDARSESECIRCFCFGESTQCRSADLFTYNMPTPLGKGGTRLVSIIQPYPGEFQLDTQPITDQYYYQPLRNGATVTKLENFGNRWNFNSDSAHPYLTLPETYNGNQLTSYGGHIRYNLSPHSLRYTQNDYFPDIIIMGKYGSLAHKYSGEKSGIIRVEARLIPENWQKFGQNGVAPATREDIMMTLDNVESILLRVDLNNAGVNITEFAMESAQHINVGLGAANLVEECTCPPGYEGLSCQKCASGYVRKRSGPWLGNCVPEQHSCPQGTYGDPASGYACQPCPCPLTNSENQFARTCAVGPSGRVLCDCLPGYMGEHCEYCDFGYVGNPNIPGDSCRRRSENQCNAVGTQKRLPLDECQCKDNVQGRYCDQCKDDSFFLSPDFRHGCALCFCTGVTSQCTSSNLRRTTTRVRFNTPQIVNQVRVYSTAPLGLSGSAKYNAPTETNLRPSLIRGIIALTNVDRSIPSIYYWSLPDTFSGDKVTSYGGFLTYTLTKVPTTDLRNTAADVQLISENRLTFHYVGDFQPTSDGSLNATVQFLEKGWERPDGKEISRELFLLALADVKAILVKATYTNQPNLASLETASIDTAEPNGYGPPALHVEECRCPIGYIGTSCEDCAPGFTRSGSGLYLEQCGPCVCNGHSTSCHPETGACYDCRDNTAGENCQDCKPGYEKTPYGDCVPGGSSFTYSPLCSCDPRGEAGPCDETGTCQCKQNVEGTYCDTCRPGTFGLDRDEPLGCLSCYCSGITNECHEATHLSRFEMAAPIFGENYGGYTLTNLNGNQIISDQFVPDPTESELTYAFSFPPDEELYWSLPVFPGNRILSYGGVLSLTQKFETGGYPTKSTPGNDVILVGDAITVYWSNPTPIQPGKALSYQVPLRERGWYILNTATPASRNDILAALKSLRRVLVRATLTNEIVSTSIADVSMDTASEVNNSGAPAAKGIEICMCPEGYRGTSCESCEPGYYIDHFGMCRQCNCNGQDCELSPYNDVVCICRPPFTGAHCSTVGGESSIYDRPSTSFRPSTSEPTVFVRITSPTIKIEEVGKSVNFTCQAQSRVTPSRLPVRWTKAGGELPQDRSYVDRNSGMLLITDLRIPDSGKYICQANDGISTVQAIATLKVPGNVIKVPSLSIRPTAKEYYEGDRIALECQATGYPAPRIGWQRAGNLPLPRSAEAIEGLLIIESALEEDSGEYRCIASNAAGSSERVAVITVKPRPNMPRDKLSISPLAPSVPEGQKIRLVCIGSPSVPAGTIEWIRQDNLKFLPNVRSDNGVLYVDVAQIENQGIYTCQSTSPGIPPVSVLLSVIPLGTPAPTDEPKITVSRDNVTVPVGGFTSVDCNPQGYPKPLIKWRRMETEFGLGTSQRENSLIFTNAQESDEGYYMCEGSVNGNPVANIYIYVHIQTPPRVEIWPQGEQAVPLGSQFELRCHVTAGDSPTDITWARTDGRPLSPNTQITKNNVLSFEKIEVNDEGEYTCVGTNAAGKASASAVIKVRSPPEIVITPSNFVQAFSGETVTVECRASGYPEPLVSIRLGRREIVPQTPRIAVLRISSVTDRDEEDYVCTATSPAGTMEEQFAIRVNRGDGGDDGGGSGFEPVPDESAAIVAFEGEDKIMDCTTATGYNVVWRRSDNRPLQNNAIQTGSSLIINRASKSDSGQYECTVVDQFTNEPQKSAFTTLNVVTPPRITLRPKTQSVQPGQSPTVECIVDGDEITDIIWRGRYGGQLPGRVESRGSNLIFHQIELEDAGEYECIARNRFANATAVAEVIVSGPRGGSSSLVSIDQPRKSFREGETAEVLCRANSRGTRVNWERYTSNQQRQYVETRTYGDGSMLVVPGVRESDAGIYRCTGRDPYGYTAFEDFNLEIVPVNIGPSATLGNEDRVYTAELGADIEMPCTHDLEPPVAIEWRREYQPLPNNIRKDEPNIRLPLVAETDAGTYVCRVSNNRVAIETRAILRVVNVVPRFEGDGWISLPTIKDAYRQFDIEISFNPTDANGLIFYNSQNEGHVGDYVALQLVNGVPEFSFDASSGPLKIRGDRPLQMNTWHTIRISRINSKVTMTLDNTGPFVAESMAQWDVLELYQPLYIGGVPNYTQISDNLARATGFMGCVSMLILGREEKNIMLDAIEKHNVKECDTCVPNMCLNKGLCQPARNERGYMCLCAAGFAGMNCDRTGDACRPGLCGPGKCVDTSDGYKCACPVSFTGNNCQDKQQIEYPAFTGSAYLAIKAPQTGRYFQMAMKIKTSSPVGDGLIMYCAESARGYGAFTSLAVHAGKLEFRYDLGDGSTPVILTANRSLTPNEWTNIHIARIGPIVSLKINLIQQFEQKLESPQKQMHLETPMFVGGVDDSIILNNNTGVSGGFSGCIKDVMVYGENVDIINNSIDSANVQECSIYDRGDIPEVDSPCALCRNGGYCATADASSCTCMAGYTGLYCNNRLPAPSRRLEPRDSCEVRPCRNNGICKPDRFSRMNYTCDCPLGFAGTNCQMSFQLLQSVGFNGNGYLELPSEKLRYDSIDKDPVIIALAFHTTSDGVLLYQREAISDVNYGDYILLRVENGRLVLDWDFGSGHSSLVIDDFYVNDGERHMVIVTLNSDYSVYLNLDNEHSKTDMTGLSNLINADSNIFIAPERILTSDDIMAMIQNIFRKLDTNMGVPHRIPKLRDPNDRI